MSKEILFTNGAVQNRDFSLDEKPEKAVGIISARILNHLVGNKDVIHTWNDVGVFADVDDTSTAKERMDKKYTSTFMKKHVMRWSEYSDSDTLSAVSDTDVDFAVWTKKLLAELLASGNIYTDIDEFIYCSTCGNAIATSLVNVKTCLRCSSSVGLAVKEERGLFVTIPDDRSTLLGYDQLFNKGNIKQELSSFKQLPPRLLLSRDRDNGIDLDSIELPGKVLDPRLGIGLLAVYLAQKEGYAAAGMVQSYSTMIRTVPYLNSVITDHNRFGLPEQKYAFHSKIDPELLFLDGISPELFCLHALRQKVDIGVDKKVQISKEQGLILNRKGIIETIAARQDIELPSDSLVLADSMSHIREGRLTLVLNEINKGLGRVIEATKQHRVIQKDVLDDLNAVYQNVRSLEPIL